jgi:hypothetical protein
MASDSWLSLSGSGNGRRSAEQGKGKTRGALVRIRKEPETAALPDESGKGHDGSNRNDRRSRQSGAQATAFRASRSRAQSGCLPGLRSVRAATALPFPGAAAHSAGSRPSLQVGKQSAEQRNEEGKRSQTCGDSMRPPGPFARGAGPAHPICIRHLCSSDAAQNHGDAKARS